MLYDFHNYQNAQKSHSVHATYLVYGTKNVDNEQSNGDVEMSSSIPEQDETPVSTLTLVREEELNGTKISECFLIELMTDFFDRYSDGIPRSDFNSCLQSCTAPAERFLSPVRSCDTTLRVFDRWRHNFCI